MVSGQPSYFRKLYASLFHTVYPGYADWMMRRECVAINPQSAKVKSPSLLIVDAVSLAFVCIVIVYSVTSFRSSACPARQIRANQNSPRKPRISLVNKPCEMAVSEEMWIDLWL